MRPEIAGDKVALPIVGEMGAANIFEAAKLGIAARAGALEDAPGTGISEVHGLRDDMKETALPGFRGARAVGGEALPEIIEDVTPGVHQAFHVDAQFHGRDTQIE